MTRRRAPQRASGGNTSYWLSFSDLMSALVLIFVLIMFYVMYQYFDMYETSSARIEQQKSELEESRSLLAVKEADLADAQAALTQREDELAAAQTVLTQREDELAASQTALTQREDELAVAQAALTQREGELAASQTALTQREGELAASQTALTERENELAVAQAALTQREDELALTQSSLAQREGELAIAQSSLSVRETELAAMQSSLTDRENELELSRSALSDSRARNEALAAQLGEKERQLATQEKALEDQRVQLENIIGVRYDIIRDLSGSLARADIACTVDSATGAITLEADVLYASGKSDLTKDGRRMIDRFLPVYLGVLLSDEYSDYVSEIIIEGHTDSRGTYLRNLELSQERALSVAQYILSDGYTGITSRQKARLRSIMTANGRAYSDPVYDANGREDMDASRRVVFKFRLTDEDMIRQMSQLLENGGME